MLQLNLIEFRFNLQFSLQVFLRSNNNLRQLMGTSNNNLCALAKKTRNGRSIFELVFQNMVKFSNIPKKGCPYPADKYFVRDFEIDGSKLPSLVPSGLYFFNINILTLENNIKTSIIQISCDVKFE